MKLKKRRQKQKKEAECILIVNQEICLGYESGFIASITTSTVATSPQLPNLLLKIECLHLLWSELTPPSSDSFFRQGNLFLACNHWRPLRRHSTKYIYTPRAPIHPPADAAARLPGCPEELCHSCPAGLRCLLGAFQKWHRSSGGGTLKPEGSLRDCRTSPRFPGEESISVIQKG